jgi:hypothetical protein
MREQSIYRERKSKNRRRANGASTLAIHQRIRTEHPRHHGALIKINKSQHVVVALEKRVSGGGGTSQPPAGVIETSFP